MIQSILEVSPSSEPPPKPTHYPHHSDSPFQLLQSQCFSPNMHRNGARRTSRNSTIKTTNDMITTYQVSNFASLTPSFPSFNRHIWISNFYSLQILSSHHYYTHYSFQHSVIILRICSSFDFTLKIQLASTKNSLQLQIIPNFINISIEKYKQK